MFASPSIYVSPIDQSIYFRSINSSVCLFFLIPINQSIYVLRCGRPCNNASGGVLEVGWRNNQIEVPTLQSTYMILEPDKLVCHTPTPNPEPCESGGWLSERGWRERETRGYEPFPLHASIHPAMLGVCDQEEGRWNRCLYKRV